MSENGNGRVAILICIMVIISRFRLATDHVDASEIDADEKCTDIRPTDFNFNYFHLIKCLSVPKGPNFK